MRLEGRDRAINHFRNPDEAMSLARLPLQPSGRVLQFGPLPALRVGPRPPATAEAIRGLAAAFIPRLQTLPISEETKTKITEWQQRFEREFLTNLNEEGREAAAMALYHLYFEVIRPHPRNDLEMALKELMQAILPPGEDVELFMEECEISCREAAVIEGEADQITNDHRNAMGLVYREINAAIEDLRRRQEQDEKHLHDLHAQRERLSKTTQDRVDSLTGQTQEILHELNAIGKQIAETSQRMEKHKAQCLRLIAQCERKIVKNP